MTDTPKPKTPVARKNSPADARGDFFYDELMTGQPEATGAYLREKLKAAAQAAEEAGRQDEAKDESD